jgi:Calcineurin-like phosphoesterase
VQLAILTDIHYAGAREQQRKGYPVAHIRNPWQRAAVMTYRHFFWHRDPFAHNHLLDAFINCARDADLVVANGDYSCDSAAIGVADAASCESAAECLSKLHRAFPDRFMATVGDHELGKKTLGGNKGGLRIESYVRSRKTLGLQRFWTREVGPFVLMGITSTLAALPVYESEAFAEEVEQWRILREEHLNEIRAGFEALRPGQRVLLFCHDPTALPFLWRDEIVRKKIGQIERTVIGHLHSRLIFFKSHLLAGMPVIRFLGHTPERLSRALREARHWKPFKVLLCPSLSGIQLLKDGGFYTTRLNDGKPLQFHWHPLPWQSPRD